MTYEIEQKLSEIFTWLDATRFDCNVESQLNMIDLICEERDMK